MLIAAELITPPNTTVFVIAFVFESAGVAALLGTTRALLMIMLVVSSGAA